MRDLCPLGGVPVSLNPLLQADLDINSRKRRIRDDFKKTLPSFLKKHNIPMHTKFTLEPHNPEASTVHIVTGASFTPYNPKVHGQNDNHAIHQTPDGEKFLMNNTAAIMMELLEQNNRVLVHSKSPDSINQAMRLNQKANLCRVIGGDLGGHDIMTDIYEKLENMMNNQPISEIKIAAYQSFAQNNGLPFKPIHEEPIEEVEGAAQRRLKFVYNMAAFSYDLLSNRNAQSLRIVSLSALASTRATYGLMADTTDKFTNEAAWRTFHLEANISTGLPVTVYQVNPGITTACDVYRKPESLGIVLDESVADGFPFAKDVFDNPEKKLPQMSSREVAWVVSAMLQTPYDENPNKNIPSRVKDLLFGGYPPEKLQIMIKNALKLYPSDVTEVDPNHSLPEHILTPLTSYGQLPNIRKGDYRRISLTPSGQFF